MFYLIPALFDYVLYGIFFISGYHLAELGASALTVSAPMAVWGIIYALSAPLAGRFTTPENAVKLLRLSGWGTAVCALLFIFFQSIWGMLVLIGVMGVVSAFYCIPFQMCANSGNAGSTPERAAGFYTFAWSAGTAAGTFGFGCLPGAAGFLVNALIGIAMVFLAGRAGKAGNEKQIERSSPQTAATEQTNSMLPVWIFGAVCALCMAAAGALLPLRCVELQTGVFFSGAVLGLLRLVQGVGALLLIRFPKVVSIPFFLVPGALSGVGGMICLACGNTLFWLFAGSLLFGLCGGIFYFSFVYHALQRGKKSARCLGVNEMILGIAGIAGPAAGGAVAQTWGTVYAFGSCAALLCAGIAAAWVTAAVMKKNYKNINMHLKDAETMKGN